ncbi:unnamed protein product, partial [Closterium sp. NIES-53]
MPKRGKWQQASSPRVKRLVAAKARTMAPRRKCPTMVGLSGAVEVVVVAVEGVGVVVGVVAGVEVSAAAVEAEEAVAVAEGAEVAEAAEAAVELVAALHRGVALVAWYAGRQRGGGTGPCTYVLRTGDHAGEQCGGLHSTQRCFGCLTDAWRHQFPETAALGAGETAALGTSASAAPGAGESALSGTASAQVFHTFTLDSGASHSFFRDRTTLTPLSRPVAVSLADPSGGPVLASFSTVLPCPAALSGTLSGLYLPSFSTNLVSGADLLDQGVDQFTPTSQRVTHCTCARTGRHLATFTRRPGSSMYTLSTESPPVPASGQAAASSQVFAAASRSGMASRVLVSSLPRSLPPLPPGPAPTCVPCVEGRQRAAPHSSEFPPTEAPLQTLHMDVIAERRIGMVMDIARTSMIHAAAPHFLWPFAVQYAAHQLNLQPRVSLPETSPTLRWTGKVGDASAFRVWGSRAFVRDLSADKLSPCAVPCVFLGFPPDALGWQFYHPTSRRVLSSQDVTFDESVPYYRLFPYRTAPLPPPPLFLAPGPPATQFEPVEIAVDSTAARGAEPVGAGSGGAESRGAQPGGAEPGGAESGGAEPGGAASGGAESGGAEPGGAESSRVASRSASLMRELLSPQELREWFARRWSHAARARGPPVTTGPGGARTGGTGAVGTGGAAAAAGVGFAGASGAAGAGAAGGVGAGDGAAGASGAAGGTGGAGPAGVGVVGAGGAAGTGATIGGLPPSPGPAPPFECPQPVQSQSPLQPVSPLPAPSPYTGTTGGLAQRREPASRPSSPVRTTRTSRRAPRPRPPAVPGTHQMALRPSTAPLRVPLPSPPESSLPFLADLESDSLRAASPTVARLLSTVVTDPSFESTAASALVAELGDFAARCRLDYATRLVAESELVCPSDGGESVLSTDVLEDKQEDFQ